ncbi:MAG TPA: hypothetical protein VGM88_21435 [Kofleriaceae bacterium]|jgi:hypothetical protein
MKGYFAFLAMGFVACKGSHATESTGNIANDRLLALSNSDRARMLGAVVAEGCEGTRAFYMGIAPDRTAEWSVGCANGREYSISIENDESGSTSDMDCRVLHAVAGISCFVPFAAEPTRSSWSEHDMHCEVAKLPRDIGRSVFANLAANIATASGLDEQSVAKHRAKSAKEADITLDRWARECDGTAKRAAPRAHAPARPAPMTPGSAPIDPYAASSTKGAGSSAADPELRIDLNDLE